MSFLRVYQIYFEEQQRELLESEYTPFFNRDCTVYFENGTIADAVTYDWHNGSDYFGVVSYKLREKIGSVMKERWAHAGIVNTSETTFSPAHFEYALRFHQPDAMSFQRHMPHDPVILAERFHPGFRKYWTHIMQEIGMPWVPTHLKDVFYCNYFIAKSEVYEGYVRDMLMPAMKVMDGMPELFANSGYPHRLPTSLAVKWSIPNYPFHPFLCERFFSWYAHVNNLNCKHY